MTGEPAPSAAEATGPAPSRSTRGRFVDLGTGTPFTLVAPAVLGVALLILPLIALVGRASWATLWQDVTSPVALDALRLSVLSGVAATALCLALGLPLALLMARSGPRVSACCGRWSRFRWCCRRWSAGSRCCSCSGAPARWAGCCRMPST